MSLELWRQTACKDVTHSVAGRQRDIDISYFFAFIMLYIMKRACIREQNTKALSWLIAKLFESRPFLPRT